MVNYIQTVNFFNVSRKTLHKISGISLPITKIVSKKVKRKIAIFFHCVKAERAEQALAVIKRPKVPRFNLDP